MKDIFHFKQFSVDQTGCGMKVNTDGVLLAALVQSENPSTILDIGTGTGVIALMLAQRFPKALIEAVEIDQQAAQTAMANFEGTTFGTRLKIYRTSFQEFSVAYPDKQFDLIVSNPPFFTNSFKNPDKKKEVARHAGELLFNELVSFTVNHLSNVGSAYFILPLEGAAQLIEGARANGLTLLRIINILSFNSKAAHRQIIKLGFESLKTIEESFVIYESEKIYSAEYKNALKDFLTIF